MHGRRAVAEPGRARWSRRPLHRANLHGRSGSNKRWDYWAVLAGDLVVSSVYSNVDHFGLADVYWADLMTGESGGHAIVVASDVIELPELPGTAPLVVNRDGLDLRIVDDASGTHLTAAWHERDGRAGQLDVMVALVPDHESLNVVIPWSDQVFNFTSKHQARPAAGDLVVGDRRWDDRRARWRASRGVCSTSVAGDGRPRSRGTGAVAPAGAPTTSWVCKWAPSGPPGPDTRRTA